jgi:small-conductance mechanosensitive channel
MTQEIPAGTQDWAAVIVAVRVVLIGLGAWVVRAFARRLVVSLGETYNLPPELVVGTRRIVTFFVYGAALLMILELLGVSATVLWTGITGFAAVAAVAFFAAWSVLSNIFCAILIFTTRPFRLHDHVELVDHGEQKGLRGRVVDINLIHTTLREVAPDGSAASSVLQVPNSQFFQRTVRRWRGDSTPAPWISAAEAEDAGSDTD